MQVLRKQGVLADMRWFQITPLILCGLLAACTGPPEIGQSGFLADYSQLKPDPAFEGAMRYQRSP